MPIPTETYMEYMRAAREQPLGLVLEVTNPQRFLLDAGIKLGKGAFPDLMICLPSTPNTIFIVQKSVELD